MSIENTRELRSIMHMHRLTVKATAYMVGVSIYTVMAWLRPPTSKSSNPMPDRMIMLLNFILNK